APAPAHGLSCDPHGVRRGRRLHLVRRRQRAVVGRPAERRHDRRPAHLDRGQRRRRRRRRPRHRPGGDQQPHLRAGAPGRRDDGGRRRGVRERPAARGADPRAGRGERPGRRRDRAARRRGPAGAGLPVRLLVPRGRRQAQPAPVDRPHLRGQVRRGGARHPRRAGPGQRRDLPDQRRRLSRQGRGAVRGARGRPGVAAPEPQAAADLPRRLRLLRQDLRLGGGGRGAAVELRGPAAQGDRPSDRPGARAEGSGDLRLRGVPLGRPGADRRRDRCPVRGDAPRRRPARRAGRSGALLAGPHALRLRHDDQGVGRQHVGARGARRLRRRPGHRAVPPV
ncbi:MAG: Zinc ABC transporter, substrate-binding protein ZnuA, partial [uncultured Frankineae bacterium]